jgi:hypothetical protein
MWIRQEGSKILALKEGLLVGDAIINQVVLP